MSGYAVSYVMPDALGSVRLVMTSTGSATFSAGYEPYGEEYETSGSTLMTYAGAVYDQAAGLYLMGARYYDPVLQRFITADSYSGDVDVPLSLNRYAYVGDDPTTYTDPSGHSWWNDITNAIVSAVSTVSNTISSVTSAIVNTVSSAVSTAANIDGRVTNVAVGTATGALSNLAGTGQRFNWNATESLSIMISSVMGTTAYGLALAYGAPVPEPWGGFFLLALIDADYYTFSYLENNPSPNPMGAEGAWANGFTFGLSCAVADADC